MYKDYYNFNTFKIRQYSKIIYVITHYFTAQLLFKVGNL